MNTVALVVAFSPSNNLTCLDAMMDDEYDASLSSLSVCFHRVQMYLFTWEHTGKIAGIFPWFDHIHHLLPLLVTLLATGYGKSVTLLLVETDLWGGLSFL